MNFVYKRARESPSLNNIRKVKFSVIEAFLSFLISNEFYRTHIYVSIYRAASRRKKI